MKQYLIKAIAESPIMIASTNTLEASQAYKVLKWKIAIKKAAEELENSRVSLVKELFTEEEQQQLNSSTLPNELHDKVLRFNEMYASLINEDCDIQFDKLSYNNWHSLCKENSLKLNGLEIELNGVLFDTSEE